MHNLLSFTMQSSSVITFPFLGGLSIDPPSYFTVFGHDIYFYGIIIALGFITGTVYCSKKSVQFGFTEDDVYDVIIWLIPFTILGARIYYVAFEWEFYSQNPGMILAIHNGGLAIYGGIIAGVLVVTLVSRFKKKPVLAFMDLLVFGLLIGQAIGRWGNFMNREAFGTQTEIFCRMGLTDVSGSTIYVHPTFLYESLWNITGFILLNIFVSKGRRKFDGQVVLMYFLWYGLGRSWIEGLRTDSLYIGATGIRVSQALSIALVIISLTLLIINLRKKHTPDEVYYNVVNGVDSCVIVSGHAEETTSDIAKK